MCVLTSHSRTTLADAYQNTPLHYAAKYGRLSVVRQICAATSNIQIQNRDGWSAAHFAAAGGSLPIIQCLFSFGDSLTSENRINWTPLHYALKYGHKDVVQFLIKNLAVSDTTFLHMAAVANDQSVVKLLLQGGLAPNGTNHNAWNALHFAASNGAEQVVDVVLPALSAGDIANRDRLQRTALMHAAINGELGVILKLDKAGADLYSHVDRFGRTALHLAADSNHVSVVNFLTGRIAVDSRDFTGLTALHLAARRGHLDVVTALVEKANIDAEDDTHRTALYLACEQSRVPVVGFLLAHGASGDRVPDGGVSLVSLAVCNGDRALVDTLIASPAIAVFAADQNRWTAVHYAAQCGAKACLALFAGLDADAFSQRDGEGRLPLHIAAEWNQPESLDFCASRPWSDVNARDAGGNTALHIAVGRGRHEVVRALLRNAACDINAQNARGETPLHVAIAKWSSDFVEELVARDDSNLNVPDSAGLTPVLLAAKLGQRQTVAFLARREDLDAGAADVGGRTAAHFAAMHKSPLVVQTMRGLGRFDFAVEDNNGARPVDIARAKKNSEVVAELSRGQEEEDAKAGDEEEDDANSKEDRSEEEDAFLILVPDNQEEEDARREEESAEDDGTIPSDDES